MQLRNFKQQHSMRHSHIVHLNITVGMSLSDHFVHVTFTLPVEFKSKIGAAHW